MIARMYLKSAAEKSVELHGMQKELERRSELDELIQKLEKEKNSIDQKIKLEMRDASYATTGQYRISWTSYDTNKLNTDLLKKEQPDIYQRYLKTTSSRRFTVRSAA